MIFSGLKESSKRILVSVPGTQMSISMVFFMLKVPSFISHSIEDYRVGVGSLIE